MDFTFYDNSGREHKMWLASPIDQLKTEAGLYAFLKWNGSYYEVLYIGEAGDLRKRLSTHDRWSDAVREGMTHVCGCTYNGTENARQELERSLIMRYNPPLNTQHTLATLGSLFGKSDNSFGSLLSGWPVKF